MFIRMIHKPLRKVLIKRGIAAEDYFEYCEEVGCDVWGVLKSIKSISGEHFEEKDYCEAIEGVQEAIQRFNLKNSGYGLDVFNPRIQLEPIGKRGYIEMLAVKAMDK